MIVFYACYSFILNKQTDLQRFLNDIKIELMCLLFLFSFLLIHLMLTTLNGTIINGFFWDSITANNPKRSVNIWTKFIGTVSIGDYCIFFRNSINSITLSNVINFTKDLHLTQISCLLDLHNAINYFT